jgi:hypothetical protein
MALAMHIQILQDRRFSNSASDDELPKKHNEWPCIFQSVLLAHSPGLALSMPTTFLSGSMILYRYLATALKGLADQCRTDTLRPCGLLASAPRKGLDPLSGQFLIPISSAESSPFVERVQYESGYDGVYFQCLSDWHDTCLSKGLRSAGGRLLSRWHAARTGIGSKRIDEDRASPV